MNKKIWWLRSYLWAYWHQTHGRLLINHLGGYVMCSACGRRRYPPGV